MAFIFILFVLVVVFFLLQKRSTPQKNHFPGNWRAILEKRVVYYKNLSHEEKNRFAESVMHFLSTVKITGVQTEIDLTDKLLVASGATIPVFGFANWEYSFLDEVLLYPKSFDRDFQIGSKREFISGMVGNGAMEGKMILSKESLHKGFDNSRDKKNVALHEFIHLIDKEDGSIDGIPANLNDNIYSLPWLDLINEKIEKIQNENIGINPYGATNRQEFLAVAGEYFFERPHLLQSRHPELYQLLSIAFNQDPQKVIDIRKQAKKSVGRNDPCPCGSGKKFKRCCMNNS